MSGGGMAVIGVIFQSKISRIFQLKISQKKEMRSWGKVFGLTRAMIL
jgi:hypothetical protein